MSTIQIELLKSMDVTQPAGKTYKQGVVTHSNLGDGKIDGKKIFDFASPKAFEVLAAAKAGDKFTVTREKDKKEGKYWNWIEVTPLADGDVVAAAPVSTPSRSVATTTPTKPVGNWETHEERAARQVMIVRQSSLATAVNLLPDNSSVETVIGVAKEFEAYVLGTGSDTPE